MDYVMVTTQGNVTIRVHRDWSPRGAARFHTLVVRAHVHVRVYACMCRVRAVLVWDFISALDMHVLVLVMLFN